LLARNVYYLGIRVDLQHMMANGLHQVGLSKSHSAIYEKWIVGFSRRFGNGERSCVGKPVGIAYYERLKRILGIERRRREIVKCLIFTGCLSVDSRSGGSLDNPDAS